MQNPWEHFAGAKNVHKGYPEILCILCAPFCREFWGGQLGCGSNPTAFQQECLCHRWQDLRTALEQFEAIEADLSPTVTAPQKS